MNIIVPISGSCMLPESAPASIMGPAGWEEIPCWALYMEENCGPGGDGGLGNMPDGCQVWGSDENFS